MVLLVSGVSRDAACSVMQIGVNEAQLQFRLIASRLVHLSLAPEETMQTFSPVQRRTRNQRIHPSAFSLLALIFIFFWTQTIQMFVEAVVQAERLNLLFSQPDMKSGRNLTRE